MSAESPRHARSGGPLLVPSQPPSERGLIDAVSGFINDVTLSSSSTIDPKDVVQWARFETADINEPTTDGDNDDTSPLLLILGYGSGVQVWLIPPTGDAQEVLSWRQGTVRVLRILPTPVNGDAYASKRPLIALCDSASPGPAFCSISFISIRGGEQVKSIKFKNPILDVLANKKSIVISFSERFAVFDAATFEDRMAITTCYPCPCPMGGSQPINPLALGDRWLAYADKKLNPSKRSSGGCESDGVTSYTATVLHAAKSLSKGLRGLGETVAHSLAGGRGTSQSPSPPNTDIQQAGVVTIIDIESNEEDGNHDSEEPYDPIVAHFVAHSDCIIALSFDGSGMLLITADKRGHDFHVFRIHPHPCGSSSAAVHHLFVLHRGDTTAKVQDIAISPDARWAAISTLRGTTHVFPLSPYGGNCAVRTHCAPRLLNRLSRFHRSAGLPITASPHQARAHSPVGDCIIQGNWFPNPRLPPFPMPTTVTPLAQLRPTANIPTHTITRNSSGRQRLSSLSEEGGGGKLVVAARITASSRGPIAPLWLLTAGARLLLLHLHPAPAHNIPKDKISDESPIELEVEGITQWQLQRPSQSCDLLAPLPHTNPLLRHPGKKFSDMYMSEEERWLSQVEIVTHAGPHRRLWMGPQFVFKTYNISGSHTSLSEAETVEVGGIARSNPVNMPTARPVILDTGSTSSLEHSPCDSFRRKSLLAESGRAASVCDVQLKEDLAEAMKEDHGCHRESRRTTEYSAVVERAVDQLGTVVLTDRGLPPPIEDDDAELYNNEDEMRFRPVVRAPASLPPSQADITAKPLPIMTTIPVRSGPLYDPERMEHLPQPLANRVFIPAISAHIDNPEPIPVRKHETAAVRLAKTVSDIELDNKINVYIDLECNKSETVNREVKYESGSAQNAERVCVVSLPKSNLPPADIQPTARTRIKESPTPKSVSDKEVENTSIKFDDTKNVKNVKNTTANETKAVKDTKVLKVSKVDSVKRIADDDKHLVIKSVVKDEPLVEVTLKLPSKKDASTPVEIKTEDQAWDMLLNETHEGAVTQKNIASADKSTDDYKGKTKRNRKANKIQEETQLKSEEDSFVEIHAIEKEQSLSSTNDLVAISSPYLESEIVNSYSGKSKKSRSSKSCTPENYDQKEVSIQIHDDYKETYSKTNEESNETPFSQFSSNIKISDIEKDVSSKHKSKYSDLSASENYYLVKEPIKTKKSKSLSPYLEGRTSVDIPFNVDKDLYIIDTVKEDFPEIQITRGNKSHKRYPMPSENKEPKLKPVKSWSSIAAVKSIRDEEIKKDYGSEEDETANESMAVDDREISLQERLAELCKRRDIVVAECDSPTLQSSASNLNFVDEHHSTMHDLPPLEPLDFGLDDFKLDVMRDSLLEVNDTKITSPICKISIDDILSSIKETTSKAIESSAFNLVDLERIPAKMERGFRVIENHKITTQSIAVDDEYKMEEKTGEVMEKSSDDDNTSPVVSTDSDKDDKKISSSASTITLKQPMVKPKKSRRKKK